MLTPYDHRLIEPKWQKKWSDENVFLTPTLKPGDKKAYILDFFPYPSGAGLHVGHMLAYTGSDVVARVARMQGKKVLHPMGWDAFGLPAENYAIKSGVHPAVSTPENIKEFKRQFNQAGISYDWNKEMNSSDPAYYRWTQWLFELFYRRGLAYRKEGMVNWCPNCQTVLANEQVVGGVCDRCGTVVIQKLLKQWYFKITQYAERLLEGLDTIDWPERIKNMQRNWIGRSEGTEIEFKLVDRPEKVTVFTTRADTLFGATFLVLAPEHTLVKEITTAEQAAQVEEYIQKTSESTELERTFTDRPKTGVFTGAYALNPATGEKIPVWIADYVLSTYGFGAIMAVPAHDERDFVFATQYKLPIIQVIEGATLPVTLKGTLINSGEFNGRQSAEAIPGILEVVGGTPRITYRLRDWLVSRQRFWGSPIPIAYDADGNEHLIPESALPVELPMDAAFLPTGQSPLVQATEWQKYLDPESGETWRREVDTLDTFVCSAWYYLRFPNPQFNDGPFDPEPLNEWLPVDMYLGGAEHAVLHLLYARFVTKVLFDEGLVNFEEPFQALHNQGMILGPDHNKMSKSKGNVINPDEVIAEHGADSLRTYELFMGPYEIEKPWSVQGILGARRFLEKTWRLQEKVVSAQASKEELAIIHRTIKKVTEDIEAFRFNTAISSLMEALNSFSNLGSICPETYMQFILLLNPFAPHITEEIWSNLGLEGFCSLAPWPAYKAEYLVQEEIEYPIQVNGKVRAKIKVSASLNEVEVLNLAKQDPKITPWLTGEIEKEMVIPGRLVSLVVK